jgi:hypothetical protein
MTAGAFILGALLGLAVAYDSEAIIRLAALWEGHWTHKRR